MGLYILFTILSIIIVIILSKVDKKICNDPSNKNDFFVLNTDNNYSNWIDDYKGRINIYKILIIVSLIPVLNFIIVLIVCLIILYYFINKSLSKLF